MLFVISAIVATLTFVSLRQLTKLETEQRDILDKMKKQVDALDSRLFSGNSRLPNG